MIRSLVCLQEKVLIVEHSFLELYCLGDVLIIDVCVDAVTEMRSGEVKLLVNGLAL